MGDLPQIDPVNYIGTKRTFLGLGYGIGGILLGFISVAIVFIGLNYTKIIDLSSILPKNISNKLPQKGFTAEEKAAKLGYKVIWKGVSEDETGRSVLVSRESTYLNKPSAFGWSAKSNSVMGAFQGWEKILGSNDVYLILSDPNTNTQIKARIINSKIPTKETNESQPTSLFVESLNDPTKMDKIDFFYNLTPQLLDKIIKKGDVIVAWPDYIPLKNGKDVAYEQSQDGKNVSILNMVAVRRFEDSSLELIKHK